MPASKVLHSSAEKRLSGCVVIFTKAFLKAPQAKMEGKNIYLLLSPPNDRKKTYESCFVSVSWCLTANHKPIWWDDDILAAVIHTFWGGTGNKIPTTPVPCVEVL